MASCPPFQHLGSISKIMQNMISFKRNPFPPMNYRKCKH
uniref:Uncharacterized protein n=1 Tax=Anguilla anguilla TaxID=7936 RepID=A0A0E9UAB1_ANGAN